MTTAQVSRLLLQVEQPGGSRLPSSAGRTPDGTDWASWCHQEPSQSILTLRLQPRDLSYSLTGKIHLTQLHPSQSEASESKQPFATCGEGQQFCPKLINSPRIWNARQMGKKHLSKGLFFFHQSQQKPGLPRNWKIHQSFLHHRPWGFIRLLLNGVQQFVFGWSTILINSIFLDPQDSVRLVFSWQNAKGYVCTSV